MCGIAGIVAYREIAPPVDRAELLAIREWMARRGPDGQGTWVSTDGRVGFAHRRLAIIDVSENGRQPMFSADGRLCITFNGEIYNYQALRTELLEKGYRFQSSSDTEVLLNLYAEFGASMLARLRGMYAFAIWDAQERTLFLARDPFGIKPLYFADDGTTLRFASQVKALLAGKAIARDPEPAGHVGFFVLGSVPEPFTMYRAVKSLPAGCSLTLRPGSAPAVQRFFDISEEMARAHDAFRDVAAEERPALLLDAVSDSVRHHMIADVPVGAFLSSGLDSSTIAALGAKLQGSKVQSVTLGFDEYRGTSDDEVPLAALTAKHIGSDHHVRWIKRQAFTDHFEHLLEAMDQPTIDGVNTYFVSLAAAQEGMKVALSGIGGDEIFGGYPSFRDVSRVHRMFRFMGSLPRAGRWARKLTAPVLSRMTSPKYASLGEYGGSVGGAYFLRRALYMPWELGAILEPDFLKEGWGKLDLLEKMQRTISGCSSNQQRIAALELSWYMRNQLLRDADWAGMAHSVEIRVPYVDVPLFRTVAPLMLSRTPPTKQEVTQGIRGMLPEALLGRRKTGFSIPVQQWASDGDGHRNRPRKIRDWAKTVYRPYKRLRALALVSDAFGGHGGIALYNRDLLSSLSAMDKMDEIVVLPRLITRQMQELPRKVRYCTDAANSKLSYLRRTAHLLATSAPFDVVICGHLNLLPLGVLAKRRDRVPLVMFIYGIDAWTPKGGIGDALLCHVDRFVSISEVTRSKFCEWSGIPKDRVAILPNAIHTDWYSSGERPPALVSRYALHGKVVIMTLGRLVSSERYKGFDEVLETMPSLLQDDPRLVYVIAGDGSDRARLEQKARDLGVGDSVRFTGEISEAEKAEHYRLADAYVMPSRGEGFGFVLLEAMACGIPTVASSLDGGREAIRDGALGVLVDPMDPEDVKRGIREALHRGKGAPPEGLTYFGFENFRSRVSKLIGDTIAAAERRPY